MAKTLAVDVGGRHVKALLEGEHGRRRFKSGPELTPEEHGRADSPGSSTAGTSTASRSACRRPSPTADVLKEPVNLGKGWKDFDFEAAFGKPTKVVNDAVMQAIGSYEGGRMLYLGLGTGLGSTMILEGTIQPMELGHLPFRRATFETYVGRAGRVRLGPKRWRQAVFETIEHLSSALQPDYVMLGGGLANELGHAARERPPRRERARVRGRLQALAVMCHNRASRLAKEATWPGT